VQLDSEDEEEESPNASVGNRDDGTDDGTSGSEGATNQQADLSQSE
jgi:hypothetical protein